MGYILGCGINNVITALLCHLTCGQFVVCVGVFKQDITDLSKFTFKNHMIPFKILVRCFYVFR